MSILRLAALGLCGASVFFFSANGYAQSGESKPDAAVPDNSTHPPVPKVANGMMDYFSRRLKVQGVVRIRVEGPQGEDFTTTPADVYGLSRIRLSIAFAPVSWLRLFSEVQDARVVSYGSKPSNAVSDPFEFRQGYVEMGKLEGSGAKVRLGRQDLFIGSNRLLTTGDWSNVTKSFDIIRGTLTTGLFNVDLIAGSPVLADPNRMDRHKPGEHFYVAYSTLKKLIPRASVEPYFMAKTALNVKSKDGKLGDADTLFGGLRIIGTIAGGFDYNAEAVREGGSFGHDTVQAFGYITGGGWTWAGMHGKPHFGSDYAWASGDSGRKDGHHQSFDYLYGAQQPPTSLTGMVAWRNIKDWRAGVDFTPLKKLKVKVDFRDYWLATTQDGLYSAAGTRTVFNAKATSNHVGQGIESQFIMTITPKTTLAVGVGTLAAGSYLKQSGKTTGYLYPFMTFTRLL